MSILKRQSPKQWIVIAVLLIMFAMIKVFLWQYYQQQNSSLTSLESDCDVAGQGCVFADGAKLQLIGVGNNQTPFQARAENVPEQTQTFIASFKMRDMDMGFNRFEFQPMGNGVWVVNPIYLPLCHSNRHDWVIEWQMDEQSFHAEFQTMAD